MRAHFGPAMCAHFGLANWPGWCRFSDNVGSDFGMGWLPIWGSLWVWFGCRVCGLRLVLLADNQLGKTRIPVCTAVIPNRGPKAPRQEVSGK